MKQCNKVKKTIAIDELVQWANEQLKREDHFACQKFKAGIFHTIQTVLMRTNNYTGFNYIHWYDGGFQQWIKDGKPDDNSKYLFKDNGGEFDRFFYPPKCTHK